jgi:hypothetical protein
MNASVVTASNLQRHRSLEFRHGHGGARLASILATLDRIRVGGSRQSVDPPDERTEISLDVSTKTPQCPGQANRAVSADALAQGSLCHSPLWLVVLLASGYRGSCGSSFWPDAGFLHWCLNCGLRIVQPMTLMMLGFYNEPAGAYLPSILY